MKPPGLISICVFAVVLSLLLDGIISGTPVRHIIQVSASVAVLRLLHRRLPWAAYAALPIFLFWLFIAALIWMYLLGVSTIASGTYTNEEIFLTVVIGVASVSGIVLVIKNRRGGWPARITASLLFLVLQILAMWLSLRPGWANR